MNRKVCSIVCAWSLFLISTPLLPAEETPHNVFLTPSVQDNHFFATASRNVENKALFEKIKIGYLIEAVRKSSLTFIRNGETHGGLAASAHLLWKYLRAGGRVKTSHDFIEGIASRSIQTGSPYLVKSPDGKNYPLRDILYNELERLRQALANKQTGT